MMRWRETRGNVRRYLTRHGWRDGQDPRRAKRALRRALAAPPTPEQRVALMRYRMEETKFLMGRGPYAGGAPPPEPPEILAPDGDLFPWARVRGPQRDEHLRVEGQHRRMR